MKETRGSSSRARSAIAAGCRGFALAGALVGPLAGELSAQIASGHGLKVGPDPYTAKFDAEELARAQLVKVGGPFVLSAPHTTADVEQVIGDVPIVWIETEHFKIGSSLAAYALDGDTRQKVKRELARLRQRLPKVKVNTAVLDPWLRAHLFAQRCEDLYAEFQQRLDVTDATFPVGRSDAGEFAADYMGEGPYLGQTEKFVVMLFEYEGSYARYSEHFTGGRTLFPRRYNYGRFRTLSFGTAVELQPRLADDTTLHCHVAYNLTANLLDGYKSYMHYLPSWWRYGLSLWFARRIDERYNDFDREENVEPDLRHDWNWRPRVLRLVTNGGASPLHELIRRMDCVDYKFRDYMSAWSLVDFIMDQYGDAGFRSFMHAMKSPVARTPAELFSADPKSILLRQDEALRDSFALDAAGLEAAWHRWVKRRYR